MIIMITFKILMVFNLPGSLYEEAALRRDEIRGYLRLRLDELPDAREYWFSHDGEDDSLSTAACDGASGFREFSGLRLVAVNTVTVSDSDDVVEGSFLDLLEAHAGFRERVRNLTAISELRNSLRAVSELRPDILLMDGSLIGTILRPVRYDGTLRADVKGWIRRNCLREISASPDTIAVHSGSFKETLKDKFKSHRPLAYLEGLERLISAWKLLKKTRNIIAVSERSTMSDIFEDIPDMTVFDELTDGPGYSVPVHRELSHLKGRFPVLDAFFRSLEFTVFYARLEENGRVLKFEVPRRISADAVADHFESLRASSAGGYPHLLRRVKDDVRITDEDMDAIAGLILEGIYR